jgi:hypothetical protein
LLEAIQLGSVAPGNPLTKAEHVAYIEAELVSLFLQQSGQQEPLGKLL